MSLSDLNSTFFALSDETRRAILEDLAAGEKPLGELAKPYDMTQTAVSQHVRLLENAGLVSIEKRGRVRHCALSDVRSLEAAFGWIKNYEQFWASALDRLEAELKASDKAKDEFK